MWASSAPTPPVETRRRSPDRRSHAQACVLPSSVVTAASRSTVPGAHATCSIVGWVNRSVHAGRVPIAGEDRRPVGEDPGPNVCHERVAPTIPSTCGLSSASSRGRA